MFSLVGMPSGWEWLIVLAIVVLVFGAAKLPELARGTGQALRIFKAETKGLMDDDDDATKTDAQRAIDAQRAEDTSRYPRPTSPQVSQPTYEPQPRSESDR